MIITDDILEEKVPKNMLPTRLDSAVNLYTNVSYKGKEGILLYNTNPDTWNCLYPFYEQNHKFTIDSYTLAKEDMTYKELIEEYRAIYKEEYEKKEAYTKDVRIQTLVEEYKKTFALTEVEIAGELTPVYELKYSKSKNVWTLYYLENYVAKKVKDLNNLLTQKLYEQKIMPIESFLKELDGIAIVSNVPYLLAISSNVDMLKQNLIKE